MLDRGGTIPDNYRWKITNGRLLAFDMDGVLVMAVPVPTTMRQALLVGYLEGWNYGQTVNEGYIEVLERLCHENDLMPREVTFTEQELESLEKAFDMEPLEPDELAEESAKKLAIEAKT